MSLRINSMAGLEGNSKFQIFNAKTHPLDSHLRDCIVNKTIRLKRTAYISDISVSPPLYKYYAASPDAKTLGIFSSSCVHRFIKSTDTNGVDALLVCLRMWEMPVNCVIVFKITW